MKSLFRLFLFKRKCWFLSFYSSATLGKKPKLVQYFNTKLSMRLIQKIGLIFLILLVVVQFIRPDKNQSGYEAIAAFEIETKASETVKSILKTNCYDCHSGQTAYPWYAEIAPMSFWLEHHIEEGQEHFNIDDWNSYSVKKKDHKLEELVEEVTEEEMPLDSYTWIHGKLGPEDKETLITWAKEARDLYPVPVD